MWRGLGLLTVLSPLLNVLSLAECIDFNSRQGIGDRVVGSANIEYVKCEIKWSWSFQSNAL